MRDLPPGTRLGTFVVVRLLGRGGMGAVYEARDASLGRSVALKVMGEGGPQQAERFRRELRSIAVLSHPNLVAIHAGDADGPVPFLVMELLPGGSLLDRVRRRGPLAWREVVELGASLADGLAAIHAARLVHRDLKPHNVLFDAAGAPKITDFGLARVERVTERLTQTGELLGTPGYMAPEQTDGSPIDARADLYALGATLYFAATGRAPFDGGSPLATITRQLSAPTPSARALAPDLPPAVDQLLGRLLARDAVDRPASAAEVGEALRELVAPPRAGSEEGPGRGALVAAVAVAVAAVAVAVAVVVAVVARRPGPPTPPPTEGPPAVPTEGPPAAPTEPATPGAGPTTPTEAVEARAPRLALGRRRGGGRWTLPGQGLSLVTLPEGRVATGDGAGFLLVFDPAGAIEASTRVTAGPLHALDARDGLLAAGGADGVLHLLGPGFRPLATAQAPPGHSIEALVLTADARRVVTLEAPEQGPPRLRLRSIVRPGDLGPPRDLGGPGDGQHGLALLPDGRLAAANGARVRLLDPERPDAAAQELELEEPAMALAAAPGGRLVTASQPDEAGRVAVRVWELEAGASRLLEEAPAQEVVALAVSPDGRRVVAGCTLGPRSEVALRAWDLASGALAWPPKDARTFGPRGAAAAVAVTADCRRALAVAGDGALACHDLTTGDDARDFERQHRASITSVVTLADGTVLTGSGDWDLGLWRGDAGAPRTTRLPGLFTGFSLARCGALEEMVLVGGEGGAAMLLTRIGESNGNARPLRLDGGGAVVRAALARDGSAALLGCDSGHVLWAALGRPGESRLRLRVPVAGLDLLPDGRALIAWQNGRVQLWRPGEPPTDLRAPRQVEPLAGGAALPADGRVLLARADGRLELWSLEALIATSPPGHERPVVALAVSPDARLALTAGLDGALRLWALPGLRPLDPVVDLAREADLPLCVTFAVDGRSAWVGTARGALVELKLE